MKREIVFALLFTSLAAWSFLNQPRAFAQSCQDEESMVKDYQKDLTALVDTARKESLGDFERAYHQKKCVTKLTLCLSLVDGLLDCLKKSSTDSTLSAEQVSAAKSSYESYSKLKSKLDQDQKALKGTDDSKTAKALVEKFDFAN